MGEGDRPHSKRTRRRVVTGVLVVALVVAGAAAWLQLTGRLGGSGPDPSEDPAAVAPPPGLELPEQEEAAPVAEPLTEGRPDAAAVRRALGRLARDKRLGRRVSILVGDVHGRP